MCLFDRLINLLLGVVLIIGGYQFYFWCQRCQLAKPRKLETFVDSLITYRPGWVWIYGGAYYAVILYSVVTVRDMRTFNYMAFSYLVLLAAHMLFFVLFPVTTPEAWRQAIVGRNPSERFLQLLQRYDAPTNCFPSMHVSVATLTALHISINQSQLYPWIMLFPVLIALSALFVKQHYCADILPGALLGWLAFISYGWMPI